MKYRPEFPGRFGALEHARSVSRDLFAWYNDAHHHSGLSYLTPADVHYGRAVTVLTDRHRTRLAAYTAHPERFVQGPPRPETLPHRGLDQSAADTPQPGGPRHDDRHSTRPAAWRGEPATTPGRSRGHARHQRGVATVNAESGCLKVVDTARDTDRGEKPT